MHNLAGSTSFPLWLKNSNAGSRECPFLDFLTVSKNSDHPKEIVNLESLSETIEGDTGDPFPSYIRVEINVFQCSVSIVPEDLQRPPIMRC